LPAVAKEDQAVEREEESDGPGDAAERPESAAFLRQAQKL
jgi:hypothetical protein